MASAANVAGSPNLSSASTTSPQTAQSNNAMRSTMKLSSKGSEGGRKQSPADSVGRRAVPQKAWTSGTNPLAQRNTTPTQQNGNVSQPKSTTSTKTSPPKDTTITDRQCGDRFKFLLTSATGTVAHVTTKYGDRYEGVISNPYPQSSNCVLSLQMTKKASTASAVHTHGAITNDSSHFVGNKPTYAMEFDLRDVVEVLVQDFKLPAAAGRANGVPSNFQTDTDISGSRNSRERELQPWVPDNDAAIDMGLDSSGPMQWDQFEANQRLFGTTSTYDESHYTTQIDRSAPYYKVREERAKKLAAEIEGKVGENAHVREERGQAMEEDGEDEETKYSGVRREQARNYQLLASGAPNTYTPPARRPPSSQPTVTGAPVDPAIVSSQLSRPDGVKVALPKANVQATDVKSEEIKPSRSMLEHSLQQAAAVDRTTNVDASTGQSVPVTTNEKPASLHASVSPHRQIIPENPTEDVENKVLEKFRQFANAEKLKLNERRRAQATQDKTAKLNDLKRFSANFKLKTPVPVDLVGILAKDPKKQEQIIERAMREHEDTASADTAPASQSQSPDSLAASRAALPSIGKFDPRSIPPPLVDRQTFLNQKNRERLPVTTGTTERQFSQQPSALGRGPPSFSQRPAASTQDQKQNPIHSIPAPIPIHEGRILPTVPMADQSSVSSPQRSNMHTPTSAVSAKFNPKAFEFRPNANAPVFNPPAPSNAPSSPAVSHRTHSVSRTATPSTFFGNRKPLSPSERVSIDDYFNPIQSMKQEQESKRADKEASNDADTHKDFKSFSSNGGIPNAFMTGPRWSVKDENAEKSYLSIFEKPAAPVSSPHTSRSSSAQHVAYHQQVPQHLQNGQHLIPQISTPQFAPQQHVSGPHYSQYDETHRMTVPTSNSGSHMYASPRMQASQLGYPSPMGHPAQLAYGQAPQYFGNHVGQVPMQMRQFSGPQFIHSPATQAAAPVMMAQAAGGYVAVPQQMPMYSPNVQYAYPQQNGYPSPGRSAPMMTQQGSQQGHHGGQPMMYTMSQQGQMGGYGHQGGQLGMRLGYAAQGPYGSSQMQPHHFQRTVSSGYGGKMMQQLSQNHGPTPHAAQQPGGYGPGDA